MILAALLIFVAASGFTSAPTKCIHARRALTTVLAAKDDTAAAKKEENEHFFELDAVLFEATRRAEIF